MPLQSELAPLLYYRGLLALHDFRCRSFQEFQEGLPHEELPEIEIAAIVLGGDGTILRAAEVTLSPQLSLFLESIWAMLDFMAEVTSPNDLRRLQIASLTPRVMSLKIAWFYDLLR